MAGQTEADQLTSLSLRAAQACDVIPTEVGISFRTVVTPVIPTQVGISFGTVAAHVIPTQVGISSGTVPQAVPTCVGTSGGDGT